MLPSPTTPVQPLLRYLVLPRTGAELAVQRGLSHPSFEGIFNCKHISPPLTPNTAHSSPTPGTHRSWQLGGQAPRTLGKAPSEPSTTRGTSPKQVLGAQDCEEEHKDHP